jgi:hypothetical protein
MLSDHPRKLICQTLVRRNEVVPFGFKLQIFDLKFVSVFLEQANFIVHEPHFLLMLGSEHVKSVFLL